MSTLTQNGTFQERKIKIFRSPCCSTKGRFQSSEVHVNSMNRRSSRKIQVWNHESGTAFLLRLLECVVQVELVTNTTFCFYIATFLVYYSSLFLSVSPSIADFKSVQLTHLKYDYKPGQQATKCAALLPRLSTCKGRFSYVCISVFQNDVKLIGQHNLYEEWS